MTADEPRIDRLAWLEGAWTGSAFGGTIDEVFAAPAGGVVLATSRVVTDGQLTNREFIVLAERDGILIYEVHLPKREPHVFNLESLGEQSVVWADPENDWPKLITYIRTGEAIEVKLEGGPGGRVEQFTMRRKAR
ncbi:MAG: hypothetical protein IT363_10245 [Methanoregulaceae archaeon]|nr:hypothetical protein [Methanoregulaceae archaeon]